MSIKYLSQLADDEIISFADIVEKGDKVAVDIERCGDDTILIKIELAPYEGVYGGIVDAYEFDDYSIIAYDVALSAEDVFEYRQQMLSHFGSEYAEEFLLNYLGVDL